VVDPLSTARPDAPCALERGAVACMADQVGL